MALAVPVLLAVLVDPRISPLLERVSEEAQVFTQKSPEFLGVETLSQRGRIAPPRFKLRKGANPAEVPGVAYRTTAIVSEYRFGNLPGAPRELHEIRVVTAVNGKPVRDRLKARLELAEGMSTDLDRFNKQTLQDLEAYGMVGAVTESGQMLMLFNRNRLSDFEFEVLPDVIHEGEPVAVLGYRQTRGRAARVYHRAMERVPLAGELWIRRSNRQPVRITAEMPVVERRSAVLHTIAVDYAPSRDGSVLLPAAVTYSRVQEGLLMVETKAVYSDFKRFSAETEIKFVAEGDPSP